jgi:pimeloyl-ACP methyl ester carboxylesterase
MEQRGHPIKIPPCPVFTDEQLQSITAPVHVLGGADSEAFDGERLVQRINNNVPRGEARLLLGAGHTLSDSHFDDCVAAIRGMIDTSVEGGQQ